METQDATTIDAQVATPDGTVFLPVYIPTIEETVKASGAHRQAAC
ncbi:MAG: hypothetical protein ACOH14_07420 [Rhodoglobus sp.]